jgi:hypothetical protein
MSYVLGKMPYVIMSSRCYICGPCRSAFAHDLPLGTTGCADACMLVSGNPLVMSLEADRVLRDQVGRPSVSHRGFSQGHGSEQLGCSRKEDENQRVGGRKSEIAKRDTARVRQRRQLRHTRGMRSFWPNVMSLQFDKAWIFSIQCHLRGWLLVVCGITWPDK